MNGYVSFASVEGLGEPPGMEVDLQDDENSRTWARWWRLWPFASGATTVEQHLGIVAAGDGGRELRPASR